MIPAIDVHAHIGNPEGFPKKKKEKEFFSLTIKELEEQIKRAEVRAVFASPMEGIFPFGPHTATSANESIRELVQDVPWLYQWAVVHPKQPETYRQAEKLLRTDKCVGIKIHPDAHGYPISQYGEELFRFAAEYGAAVETHTGDAFSMPEEYIEYANWYSDVTIILSHLGNGCDGEIEHQIRAISNSRHGNLYTDVSSAKSILFHLIEWAVKEIGSEKILFGTDTPLHHIGMMRSRIDYADLTIEEKENIFYKNACRIFQKSLSAETYESLRNSN